MKGKGFDLYLIKEGIFVVLIKALKVTEYTNIILDKLQKMHKTEDKISKALGRVIQSGGYIGDAEFKIQKDYWEMISNATGTGRLVVEPYDFIYMKIPSEEENLLKHRIFFILIMEFVDVSFQHLIDLGFSFEQKVYRYILDQLVNFISIREEYGPNLSEHGDLKVSFSV